MTQDGPDGSVIIGPGEMFGQLQALAASNGRMEQKLDQAIGEQARRIGEQAQTIKDHEARLRHLEERRLPQSTMSWLSLAVAALVGVLSLWGHM